VPNAVTTTSEALGESRVRLAVSVPSSEIERRVMQRAQALGGELKIAGFRRGHVPAPMVIKRLGREVVLEEAIRESLSTWYAAALDESGYVPVGDPKIDLGDLPAAGGDLGFTIEIGVLPSAVLGEYRGLEVPRREPVAADDIVQQELDTMRERLARLETVERAAAKGDFTVIDYVGSLPGADGELEPFEGGTGRDQLIELGSESLIPGFEAGLLGSAAGDERTLELDFPADYGAEHLAGRSASFAVTVKEVRERRLPELDEDFAADAGFDSVEELREDIQTRVKEADERRSEAEFRQAALDAAVEAASVPLTDELIEARAREMWDRTLHSLSHRGISRESYLQIIGREEADVIAELREQAELGLRREAVVKAIVDAEQIKPSDEQLLDALRPAAEEEGVTPEALLERLGDAGRLDEAREDLAARMAIDLLADNAKPITPEQAEVREKLWTPEEQAGETDKGSALWTPDR
jgi:trigger factor